MMSGLAGVADIDPLALLLLPLLLLVPQAASAMLAMLSTIPDRITVDRDINQTPLLWGTTRSRSLVRIVGTRDSLSHLDDMFLTVTEA